MHRDAGFWNRIAKRYARTPVPDAAAYERKLDITRRYLTPDAEVFEFGCGTGTTALIHAPRVAHIRAIDISPAMLEIARGKAEAQGITNVTFEESGIDEVDAPDGAYDVVMGHSILHLVPDRDRAIARAFALLRPGGVFVSSTMCIRDGLAPLAPLVNAGAVFGLLPRVRSFTANDLRGAIERAGFEVVEDWRPGKRKATFLVARKPAPQSS